MPSARLEKLLEMLGSSFDGERLNAARLIDAMAKADKLTISELMRREFSGMILPRGKVEYWKTQPGHRRQPAHVEPLDDEIHPHTGGLDEARRRKLAMLAELFEEERIDDRDARFVENVLHGYQQDAAIPPRSLQRVNRILRSFGLGA